jgi:pimeloyl-ACP methyl ester carboxylesterase
VVYLHGFTSSPASSKAQRFKRELAERGVGFSCPDFNLPDFESLTVTRMLRETARAIAAASEGPIALVGSSLGAFVAVHAAEAAPDARVDRLILLAPALDFGGNRLRQLGEHGIDEWRRAGRLEVFHHGQNRPRHIGFRLYEDAGRYDAFATGWRLPAIVYQGTRDELVDPVTVARWADARPNVALHLVDDGHQLVASMDEIWKGSEAFLGL